MPFAAATGRICAHPAVFPMTCRHTRRYFSKSHYALSEVCNKELPRSAEQILAKNLLVEGLAYQLIGQP